MVTAEETIRRSVQTTPSVSSADAVGTDYGTGDPLSEVHLYSIAAFADEIAPWGTLIKLRDIQLREYLPTESHLISAFSTVAARNAAFSWKLDGGPRQVKRAQDILLHANFGAGWRSFVIRFTLDVLGQDNGAFVEFIREADRPTARVIGIANLDAGRCWRTGDPRNPVLYRALDGSRHLMPWWRVAAVSEMPSNIERLRGLQYSAMTRALEVSRLFRDIHRFQREKMGGRRPQAIHFVNGVAAQKIADALAKQKAWADNQNLYRYLEPLIVEGLKPDNPVSTATIELASLPDNFDALSAWNMYIDGLAMALLIDRQDLAPLTGGNIGTSTQSQVLAQKTRGKGPALFMKLIEDLFNFYGVLGEGVEFAFDEQDLTMDQEQATVDKTRAEGRNVYVTAGILTPQIIRQQMVDSGELEPEYLELMNEQDVTDETTATDESPVDNEAEIDPASVADLGGAAPAVAVGVFQAGARARRDPAIPAMDETEEDARRRFREALSSTREAFTRAVRKQVPAEAKVVKEVRAVADEARRQVEDAGRIVAETREEAAKAIRDAARENADAIRQAAVAQSQATAALAESVKQSSRLKRRVVEERDERGLVKATREEYVDG